MSSRFKSLEELNAEFFAKIAEKNNAIVEENDSVIPNEPVVEFDGIVPDDKDNLVASSNDSNVSEETAETKEDILEETAETEEEVLEETTEAEEEVLEEIIEAEEDVLEEVTETEEDISEEKAETEEDILEEKAETKEDNLEEAVDTHEDISDETVDTQEDISEETVDTHEDILEETAETKEDVLEETDEIVLEEKQKLEAAKEKLEKEIEQSRVLFTAQGEESRKDAINDYKSKIEVNDIINEVIGSNTENNISEDTKNVEIKEEIVEYSDTNKKFLNHIKKIVRIFTNIIFFGIIFFVIVGAIYIATSGTNKTSVFGYRCYEVLTSSMSPEYNPGDLIIVKNTDAKDIKVNDVITFNPSKNSSSYYLTHRVIEKIDNYESTKKPAFKTKGDANKAGDAFTVKSDQVIGKVVLSVASLGKFLRFVSENIGLILIILSLLVIFCLLLRALFDVKRKSKVN